MQEMLSEALVEIKSTGMYWNAGISRTQTGALSHLIEKHGYKVSITEVPPEWEHVFDTTGASYKKLCEIANSRVTSF